MSGTKRETERTGKVQIYKNKQLESGGEVRRAEDKGTGQLSQEVTQ